MHDTLNVGYRPAYATLIAACAFQHGPRAVFVSGLNLQIGGDSYLHLV